MVHITQFSLLHSREKLLLLYPQCLVRHLVITVAHTGRDDLISHGVIMILTHVTALVLAYFLPQYSSSSSSLASVRRRLMSYFLWFCLSQIKTTPSSLLDTWCGNQTHSNVIYFGLMQSLCDNEYCQQVVEPLLQCSHLSQPRKDQILLQLLHLPLHHRPPLQKDKH